MDATSKKSVLVKSMDVSSKDKESNLRSRYSTNLACSVPSTGFVHSDRIANPPYNSKIKTVAFNHEKWTSYDDGRHNNLQQAASNIDHFKDENFDEYSKNEESFESSFIQPNDTNGEQLFKNHARLKNDNVDEVTISDDPTQTIGDIAHQVTISQTSIPRLKHSLQARNREIEMMTEKFSNGLNHRNALIHQFAALNLGTFGIRVLDPSTIETRICSDGSTWIDTLIISQGNQAIVNGNIQSHCLRSAMKCGIEKASEALSDLQEKIFALGKDCGINIQVFLDTKSLKTVLDEKLQAILKAKIIQISLEAQLDERHQLELQKWALLQDYEELNRNIEQLICELQEIPQLGNEKCIKWAEEYRDRGALEW